MDKNLCDMIFKRKSFHLFRNTLKISEDELDIIKNKVEELAPLDPNIKTAIRIVAKSDGVGRMGSEYSILFYSEEKDSFLKNIGYLGEQLDLFLASMDIGSLWLGMGKPDMESYEGLKFVIMISIAKMPEDTFRKDMFKSKRKPPDKIWDGEDYGIANIARFAPSACNTQPWLVEREGNLLKVYRHKPPKFGLMPVSKFSYYNRIDVGIFMAFLELCLEKENIKFVRTLHFDDGNKDAELTLNAEYIIKENHEG